MSGPPIFRADRARVELGGRKVLALHRLEIGGGGLTALVGPNGSGKTVMLTLLAGLRLPTAGEIFYRGTATSDARHRRNMRGEVTLLHQNAYLFRGTVASNVAFGLRVRGVPAAKRRPLVEGVLAQVGLDGMAGRSAGELSGGEAQRVALARALVFSPAVLLLDEPTANVDAANVRILEALIQGIAGEEKRTVIFTTHNLEQAYRLAGNVLFLSNGNLSSSPLMSVGQGGRKE